MRTRSKRGWTRLASAEVLRQRACGIHTLRVLETGNREKFMVSRVLGVKEHCNDELTEIVHIYTWFGRSMPGRLK